MTLALYNIQSGQILPFPRSDDQIPLGLDRQQFHVLAETRLSPPDLLPGQSASPAPPLVVIDDPTSQGVNGTVTYGWAVHAPPPPEPQPQWLEFVTWLYGQPVMMTAMDAARLSTNPQGEPATTALPAALQEARLQQNYPAFALTWGQFLLASGLPPQALAPIVAKASEFNLPAEFIAALQPQSPPG